jgi:glycosyltransferase involved in cell wall biosynthesis
MSRLSRALISSSAAALIANSAYTAEAFGAPGARHIYNPVDLSRFDPDSHDGAVTRLALGLSEDDLVLAVIAQVTPWKGQLDALRAHARIASRWPNLHLLVVGAPTFVARATRFANDAYLRELRAFVAAEGLERHVHFLGNRDDVPQLLAACDVVLAPSWEEPFGRSIVEAMAMGVPVLATSVGGPKEILHDAVDGVLLPPREPAHWAEAIDRLLASPAARAEIGRHARRRALATFGVAAHAREVLGVYDAVMTASSKAGADVSRRASPQAGLPRSGSRRAAMPARARALLRPAQALPRGPRRPRAR